MSQWLAVAFSTWFTWIIYLSEVPQGTEVHEDLVVWITWFLLLVSLTSFYMDDLFLAQLKPKSHWLKAGADINILAQIFLLVVTGHWQLGAVRALSEIIARGNSNAAHHRISETIRRMDQVIAAEEVRSELRDQ